MYHKVPHPVQRSPSKYGKEYIGRDIHILVLLFRAYEKADHRNATQQDKEAPRREQQGHAHKTCGEGNGQEAVRFFV